MVNDRSIVVCLCEPEFIPHFVVVQAFDVPLAPLADPFGNDIENKLDITATQIAYFSWLLEYILTNKFEKLNTHRDTSGHVIPRYLTQFEPRDIEPEYSFDNYFAFAFPHSESKN